MTFDDVQVIGTLDFGLLTAVLTYAAISSSGQELRSPQNRLTWRSPGAKGAGRSFTSTPPRRSCTTDSRCFCAGLRELTDRRIELPERPVELTVLVADTRRRRCRRA